MGYGPGLTGFSDTYYTLAAGGTTTAGSTQTIVALAATLSTPVAITGRGVLVLANHDPTAMLYYNAGAASASSPGVPPGQVLPIPVKDIAPFQVFGSAAFSWAFYTP